MAFHCTMMNRPPREVGRRPRYSAGVKVVHTIPDCRAACLGLSSLGFVPTMGALHAGHQSLVDHARRHARHVAVSIFVNPTQFGPHEDFTRYPRPIEQDLEMCRSAGVDVVCVPGVAEMYPDDAAKVLIDIPALTSVLEGRHRPGHFAGVCEVVAKLFNIVRPAVACFGEKDFQQLAVIKAMVKALDMPLEIIGCPTLRDPDGMAMSSRNRYLSSSERTRGLTISRTLRAVQERVAGGERDAVRLREFMRRQLEADSEGTNVPIDLQYATIVDAATLHEVGVIDAPARALVAMRVGSTRLIDNMALVGS